MTVALDDIVISKAAPDLIKHYEGLKLKAYQCSADVWSIGYGHTGRAAPPDVEPGMVWTEEQADAALRDDLHAVSAPLAADMNANGFSLSPNQFGAFASLAFNIGSDKVLGSTAWRLLKDYKAGDGTVAPEDIANAMLLWNQANGEVLEGLRRRRMAEAALFLRP